uniref:Uncharacterized protein n=1 Tax=Cacopsylla melanoneura TaxID=428564 RepID=A0A8D8TDE1_9HEMI
MVTILHTGGWRGRRGRVLGERGRGETDLVQIGRQGNVVQIELGGDVQIGRRRVRVVKRRKMNGSQIDVGRFSTPAGHCWLVRRPEIDLGNLTATASSSITS